MTKYVEMILRWFGKLTPAGQTTLGACMLVVSVWLTPFILSLQDDNYLTREWWVAPVGVTGTLGVIAGLILAVFGIIDFYDAEKKEKS